MFQVSAQLPIQPWERDLQKFYNQDRKMLQLRLRIPAPLPDDTPTDDEPVFSPFAAGYDRNGDGAVTREEYFANQRRELGVGAGSASRQQRGLRRLDSQFRNADIDHDGKVTARELNSLPCARI